MRRLLPLFLCLCWAATGAMAQAPPVHNVILFVPDGLRAAVVDPDLTPTMAALREEGVNLVNSHSHFPTFTTANASVFATGHYIGDTGNFSNSIYAGFPVVAAKDNPIVSMENNGVVAELDAHFGGNFLHEETLLKAARERGYSVGAIGKLGPVLFFDHAHRDVLFDDATGSPRGSALPDEIKAALTAAGLPLATPPRGDNGKRGNATTPGALVANIAQQSYFIDVATKVVLPLFKARNKPFVLVYWSRDPDGTLHFHGDSLNKLVPGVNGPTGMAATRNADDNLRRLREALKELGLAETTNILVAADHGMATISKQSETSPAAKVDYKDVPKGFLPPGFAALDLAKTLGLSVFEPGKGHERVAEGSHPRGGHAILSREDPTKPELIVATNGGVELIYTPSKDKALAGRTVEALLQQDYVGGLFVNDELGRFPGTLPMSAVNLIGAAVTPRPDIVVSLRSYSTGCDKPLVCTAVVSDTSLSQGQGMHGSISRAETRNFMAAVGPDFKKGYVNLVPVSNADVSITIAHLLRLNIAPKGKLAGRVMTEALAGGQEPAVTRHVLRSEPTAQGLATIMVYQETQGRRYFDVAGIPGRVVGLDEK